MGGPSASEKQLQTEQSQQVQQEIQQQQTQYAESQDLYNTLKPQLEALINNPTGFSPQEIADLNASNVNTTGAQYANVQKQLNLRNASENMAGLTSGVAAGETAALQGEAAGVVASNATNIELQNAQLQEQKRQAATSELLGLESGKTSAAIGIGGVENQAESTAFNQAFQEQQQTSQLMSGILGGLVQKGTDFLSGGLSSVAQGNSFLEGGVSALG